MRNKIILWAVLLLLICSFYYSTKQEDLRTLAEQGIANAQNQLGYMHLSGEGAPQDYAKAVKWFRKAAEQGHVDAQCNLGLMYYEGKGVPQDDTEATKWLIMADRQGYPVAKYWLGEMFDKGKTIPQDYVEVAKSYSEAASKPK